MPNPYVLMDQLKLNREQLLLLRAHALDDLTKARHIRDLARTIYLASRNELTDAAYVAAQNEACHSYSCLSAIEGHLLHIEESTGGDDSYLVTVQRDHESERTPAEAREQVRLGEGDFLHDQEMEEKIIYGDSGCA